MQVTHVLLNFIGHYISFSASHSSPLGLPLNLTVAHCDLTKSRISPISQNTELTLLWWGHVAISIVLLYCTIQYKILQ